VGKTSLVDDLAGLSVLLPASQPHVVVLNSDKMRTQPGFQSSRWGAGILGTERTLIRT
jgi:hypothetical protein